VTNTSHGKRHRNEDIVFKVLVLGTAPSKIAAEENISLPRVNQIVTQYGMQVLGAPVGSQRPLKVLKAWVEKNCLKDGRLVPQRA
jgi:hypothetical protein